MRLVTDAAQPHDEMRQPAVGPDDQIHQSRPAGEQHFGTLHDEILNRRDHPRAQPRLGDGVQCPVAPFDHSRTGLSSGARSNQRNP